jgi:hypothetical protein
VEAESQPVRTRADAAMSVKAFIRLPVRRE